MNAHLDMLDDTISALATSLHEGSIGIVRLSGEKALQIAAKIFFPKNGTSFLHAQSHRVMYGQIKNEYGKIIDEALAFSMQKPHSYTREDIVEIQSHGGKMVLSEILRLTYFYGARAAEGGEFTKRAFLNGRIDLLEAQAVMDIISAKSKQSLFITAGQLTGKTSAKIKNIRTRILYILSSLEVAIDYPEEDIEDFTIQEMKIKIDEIIFEIEKILATFKIGQILTHGLKTAIIGKPNAGKSSFFNALLQEERAIVTDIEGTTRDIIKEKLYIENIPLDIIDTAGIRRTKDKIEKIGIEKTKKAIQEADLTLFLLDTTTPFEKEDRDILNLLDGKEKIILLSKSDASLYQDKERDEILRKLVHETPILKISSKTGAGFVALKEAIKTHVYKNNHLLQQIDEDTIIINNIRAEKILQATKKHLQEALLTIKNEMSCDFITIDLRRALEKLGELTGENVTDDLITNIFQNFCVGK